MAPLAIQHRLVCPEPQHPAAMGGGWDYGRKVPTKYHRILVFSNIRTTVQ